MASLVHALKLFRAIRELRGITPHEKLMLFILASLGDSEGRDIHPGHAYLSACTMLAERTVRKVLNGLETKGYLEDDGRLKYVRRYKLNLPGITPKILTTPDISREEWESNFLLDDEDKTEVKLPAVIIPTTPPAGQPPGRVLTPEEQHEKALDFIWDCIKMAHEKPKAGMTYEKILTQAKRKGIPDDDVDWLWKSYEETDSSLVGSQPRVDEPESEAMNFPQTRNIYQP